MDSTRFDALARAVAAPASRRAALRLAAAALLGGLLPGRVAAAQRPDRDFDGLFDDDEALVYGTDPDVYDTDGDGSGDGEEVYYGTDPLSSGAPAPGLVCNAGFTDCNGFCVDLVNDRTNCGACGVTCAEFVNCFDGACGGTGPAPAPAPATCAAGLSNCNGTCVSVFHDVNNCGFCGNTCLPNTFCYQGNCVPYCEAGTRRCTGDIFCTPAAVPCP
jgi:hypothetical protein